MVERQIDEQQLKERAMQIVRRLKDVAANHERTYPAEIEAVLVFSGPGTYFDKLKPEQDEIWRWMDRDRIRAGVSVVREVTATRLSNFIRKEFKGHYVDKIDIENDGPDFV